jgi:predicted PhzF superfamily epimerase YddE/YHI9
MSSVMSSSDERTLHVVRVFVGPDGRGGNPLGVFLDAGDLDRATRQRIAADLGFSETVFVSDAARGELSIHTPAVELPLAGHPLVGTAWLLARERAAVDVLRPPAGEVPTWTEGERTWIRADPAQAPEFDLNQLASPADVDAHPGAGPDEHLQVWAWQDEQAGVVRARVFPTVMGIAEDEATGAAALRLAAQLARPLTINQGEASQLHTRPTPSHLIEVGGTVHPLQSRPYTP